MILQALTEYYNRKAADKSSQIAPPGFEWKEIPYIVVLDTDGNPVNIESTYEGEGKKQRAKRFLVPHAVKRTVGIAANLLWDNPAYALGIWIHDSKKGSNKSEKEQRQRVADQHEDFKQRIEHLFGEKPNPALIALRRFLDFEDKESILKKFDELLEEALTKGANFSFRLSGDKEIVVEKNIVREAVQNEALISATEKELCLVTGNSDSIKRLHAPIKGVYGAQTSGANIISFNLDAFQSFGKDQGANAPVGETAAFAYTTALNHLLTKGSEQKILVGDSSTVFWAAKAEDAEMEQAFSAFFNEPPKDDPDKGAQAVKSLFHSIHSGAYQTDDSDRRFYVLGLAPNASRIAIRFWFADKISNMAGKIAEHFSDLAICHSSKDKDALSLFRLLSSIAAQRKSENIPPKLAGETMRSILEGLPYPRTLLQAAVRRNRAEQEVTYARASLIKACINRSTRFNQPTLKEELKVSLDLENTNIGYRLGRLFAVLEKIQSEANPGLNATIRDRYYGAAAGTPVSVFSTLMRLKNHHLSKLESIGRRIYFENMLGAVIDGINDFPAHLSLEDQGRFAIGYYHQNRDFYTKKIKPESSNEESNEGESK